VGKDMGISRTKPPLSLKINVLERKNGGERDRITNGLFCSLIFEKAINYGSY
jgi:hypothetical protein